MDVTLGLETDTKVASKAVLTEVVKKFATFSKDQHLDTIFLDSAESVAIAEVAKPFYSRAPA